MYANIIDYMLICKPVSSCVITICVAANSMDNTIVQVYAPTPDTKKQKVEVSNAKVENNIREVPYKSTS